MTEKYMKWIRELQDLFLNQEEFSEEIFDWLEEAAEYRYLYELEKRKEESKEMRHAA